MLIKGVGLANRHTFYIGKDGKILRVDRDVSPGTHGKDVVAALKTLEVPTRIP